MNLIRNIQAMLPVPMDKPKDSERLDQALGTFVKDQTALAEEIERGHSGYQAKLREMQDKNNQRLKEIEEQSRVLSQQLEKSRNTPPVVPLVKSSSILPKSEFPLEHYMNERSEKQEMEENDWKILITIDLATVDKLVRREDYVNDVAYSNFRDYLIKSTLPDFHPGFVVTVRVGSMVCSKSMIHPTRSKESVMNSPEFISVFTEILALLKDKVS